MIAWATLVEASEWGESWAAAKYFGWPVAAAKGRSCRSSAVIVVELQAVEDFWTCVGQALALRCVGESDALQRMGCALAVAVTVVATLCTALAVHPWHYVQGCQRGVGALAVTRCVFALRRV